MPNLNTVELKTMVPAKDFERSKAFYQAIGFSMPWSDESLAYLHAGSSSFLLQNFYVREQAENFVMHLLVEDVEAWYQQVLNSRVVEDFGVRLLPPEDRPWGMRDFVLFDPSGVLWRIAQN